MWTVQLIRKCRRFLNGHLQSLDKSKIQQHIGAHILQETWKQYLPKKRPRYPCGLFGLRWALGVDPKQAQEDGVTDCYMWIDQSGKKTMQECKLLGSVSYNIATTSKCLLVMPRTNRQFKCNMPCWNLYVWTYSMKTHHADKHEGVEMSEDVKNQVLLKLHECTYVHRLVRTYTKGIKTLCPTLMKNKEAKCTKAHVYCSVIRSRMFGVYG